VNKKPSEQENSLVIYQTQSGEIELRGDFSRETIWANLNQIAQLFGVQKAAVSKHIKNIFETGELIQKVTVSKMETVKKEGNREVLRTIEMYNLDMIIAVGYRVNSKNATQFRIWATKILREYLLDGYSINKKRLQQNHQNFLKDVASIQALLPIDVSLDNHAVLELVKEFSATWTSLDAYDRDSLEKITSHKKSVKVSSTELLESIQTLRKDLIKKGEATDIFAQERTLGSIEGILGNVIQSFGGQDVYPSLEEKSAQLLYFMVKNHPFIDGNKRSGAWAFIWFLRKVKLKSYKNINPTALTALTLLIAESKPDKKEQMIALVTNLLALKK
jgi:prophage maintenance system killer protein